MPDSLVVILTQMVSSCAAVLLGVAVVMAELGWHLFTNRLEQARQLAVGALELLDPIRDEALRADLLCRTYESLTTTLDFWLARAQGGRTYVRVLGLAAILGLAFPFGTLLLAGHPLVPASAAVSVFFALLLAFLAWLIWRMADPRTLSHAVYLLGDTLGAYFQRLQLVLIAHQYGERCSRDAAIERASTLIRSASRDRVTVHLVTARYSWIGERPFREALKEAQRTGVQVKFAGPEPTTKPSDRAARSGWRDHGALLGWENWIPSPSSPVRGVVVGDRAILGMRTLADEYLVLPDDCPVAREFSRQLRDHLDRLAQRLSGPTS